MHTFFKSLIASTFGVKMSQIPDVTVIDTKGDIITIHFKGGSKRTYRVSLEKLEEKP